MIKNIRIRVKPEIWADQQKLEQEIAQQNAISPKAIRGIRTIHRSIDARQRQVMIQLDVDVYINENPPVELFTPKEYREVKGDRQAVVVGLGPGGLFAALKLIELGIKPIVLERGKNVTDRRRDVALITREQKVDPESNFCFGEGGAGAFSDGKLFLNFITYHTMYGTSTNSNKKNKGFLNSILYDLYILISFYNFNPNLNLNANFNANLFQLTSRMVLSITGKIFAGQSGSFNSSLPLGGVGEGSHPYNVNI